MDKVLTYLKKALNAALKVDGDFPTARSCSRPGKVLRRDRLLLLNHGIAREVQLCV